LFLSKKKIMPIKDTKDIKNKRYKPLDK